VLDLMARSGFITFAQADAAYAEELAYNDPHENVFVAPHFVVYVEKALEDRLGAERIARGGLEVTTTLDLGLQTAAEQIVREHVDALRDRHHLTNASVVVREPRTGEILAMVGSKDYWDDAIDGRVNVSVRLRQPGSSIKPITYVTAIDQGLPTSTMLWDVKMERLTPQGLYEPKNYDGVFHGPVRLRAALANSYNIPALKLLELVGVRNMIEVANRMGLSTLDPESDRYGLSITLGGGEVTLIDMTTAFSALANGGLRVEPNPFRRIVTTGGEPVFPTAAEQDALANPPRVIGAPAAYIVTDILSDNAARTPAFGPTSPLNVGVPAAVKTGTTDDYKDNWTVGYTPYVTVGVWAGNSDNSEMRNSSGVTGAAPIWRDVTRAVTLQSDRQSLLRAIREEHGFHFRESFERPSGVVEKAVCDLESLQPLAPDCTKHQTELFVEGHVPEQDVWLRVPAVVVRTDPAPVAEGEPAVAGYRVCTPYATVGIDKLQGVAALPLPTDEQERLDVIEWAQGRWAALEPWEPCTDEMVAAALPAGAIGPAGDALFGVSAVATEYRLGIAPGTVITQSTVLTGTVSYNPADIEYFKVELGAGAAPSEWITLGDIHHGFVTNGPLEVLDAGALAPGEYIVRLVLVRRDGNFQRPPHAVPIRIGR
jgi:membrane peptidoglycan carboxypeptidase